MNGDLWPDGEPVTPWADPWHDIAGDMRDFMRAAFNGSPYQVTPPPGGDDDSHSTRGCGSAYCDACGDCLACYGDTECPIAGDHSWPDREEPT